MKRTRYISQASNTRRLKQTNLTELKIYPTPHNFFSCLPRVPIVYKLPCSRKGNNCYEGYTIFKKHVIVVAIIFSVGSCPSISFVWQYGILFFDGLGGGLAGQSLHKICEGSEGTGGWAVDEELQGGVFVLHLSLRLCVSIPLQTWKSQWKWTVAGWIDLPLLSPTWYTLYMRLNWTFSKMVDVLTVFT